MVTDLRRNGFPRQNIETFKRKCMKKERGQVNWIMGLFLALFMAVLLLTAVQCRRFQVAAIFAEDALAASNLASTLVNLEEYGISHKILISNPAQAYERYRTALQGNLNLNKEWKGPEGSVILGPVTVENYTVYNVDGEKVWVHCFGADGEYVREEMLGTEAPNGRIIESTSVYSEISFEMEVIPGIRIRARKGQLADVVAGEE